MKILSIGLVTLFSVSSFAQNGFTVMPRGALKNGSLTNGQYHFTVQKNVATAAIDELVLTQMSDLKRQRNSGYSHNVGKYDAEATGRITDIKTTFKIKVKVKSQIYDCLMESALLSDSFDYIGYDDARYTCEVHGPFQAYKIILRDYSENKKRSGKAFYELGLAAIDKGFAGGKKTIVLAEINAK
jgi:hypothetical protein